MEIKIFILLLLLCSCKDRFSNKRTSRIYDLNIECVNSLVWTDLEKYHSVDSIQSNDFLSQLKMFKQLSFSVEIYHFQEPEELIAISSEHDCVRYVYNPQIKKSIMDGLELSKKDRERVGNRIQEFLRKYQCETERNHRYIQEWDKDKN